MSGKFYNLDTRSTLGGDGASDFYVASQKAVKEYVDTAISTLPVVNTEYLKDLKDVNLTSLANGQSLVYNTTTQKWENKAIDVSIATWGKITGSISAQTDLNNALSAKANLSHTHVKSEITDLVMPSALSDLTDDLGDEPIHTHKQYLTEHQDISGKQDKITSTNKLSSDLVDDTNKTHKFVTSTQINTWNNKQDAIQDLATIRALATSALQTGDNVSSLTNDAGYLTSDDISSVFVYKGSKATVDQLPTTGNKKGDVWTVTSDGSEYVWNGTSWEYLGEILDLSGYQTKLTATNKLNADYIQDGTTNKVVTQTEKNTWSGKQDALSQTQLDNIEAAGTALQPNDNVSELVNDAGYLTEHQDISGKQDKIDSTHKLSADLVDDSTTTNKFVTAANKTTWNNKQDAISDLATIRANATAGKAAKDAVDAMGDIVSHDAEEFAAASHLHAISDVTNLQTTLNGKQATIQDLETIRTNATAGKGAADTIATYGDIVTHSASEFLTEHQDISGKANISDLGATAFSNSYNDLDDKPTIGNGTVTIKRNGTSVGSFKMNQTGNGSIDITVPTTYTDVNAASTSHTHSYSDMGAASAAHTHTYSDVGAASAAHTHSTYVANTRKVAGHALSADVTISSSDITDLSTTISTAISGKANSTEVYTKTEIDGKLASGMHYKGTKASESALPSTGNEIGDLWNVTDTGANYAWNGTAWDKLSENIDLSGLVPNTRTINGKTLNADITLSYSDVGAASTSHTHNYVPTSRKVNGKTLNADITLTYSDVSAASSGHTHTYSDVGAASAGHTHSNYVPTTRKVAGKALSADVTLSASDVGALPSDTAIPSNVSDLNNDAGYITGVTWNDVTGKPSTFTPSAHKHLTSDVTALTGYTIATQAASITATDSLNVALGKIQKSLDGKQASGSYVTTSRKVNGKALSADVTLSASDVSALPADTVIPTVNNVNITIQRNGTAVGTIKTNQSTASAINISVPTSYGDVGAASEAHTHSYTYSDVGAASAGHTHTYSDVGAASASHTHNYVPTSRKINGKTLNADVTLTYTDVTAASSGHTHTYSDVGAASANHTHTYTDVGAASANHTHSNYAPTSHKHSTADVTVLTGYTIAETATAIAATDTLNIALGKIQKSIDGKQPSGNYADASHTHTKSEITDFPTIPTVYNSGVTIKRNGTAVGSFTLNKSTATNIDITVPTTYTDVNAASASHTHTYSDVGAASAAHTHAYVPTSRKVAGKALSADVTLSASDVGALPDSTVIPTVNDGKLIVKRNSTAVGTFTANQTGTVNVDITVPTTYSDVSAASAGHTHTYSDVGAASSAHTHSNYVATSRKVAGHALTADVTISSADIGDLGTTISTAISGKANTTEVYSKSEIDGKLSGAMHFKGTKASVSNLPTTGNTQGDMWNVTDTGANYAWDGSAWDKLSENIDLSGLVPNTRKVNNKALSADISLTYSDVGAASSGHTHSYVPTSRKINGKTLNADVTLSYSDVGALSAATVIPVIPTNVSAFTNDVGYLTEHQSLADYQKKNTAVTHTASTAAGNTITPVYVNASGVATALSYTIAKSVPSDAKFSDTTYTAGTGLSLSGTQFKHSNSVTAGTAGTNAATSGSTLAVPYVTYDAQGHITATGTHTHTVTGFSATGHTHTKSEITDFPTIPTVNNSGVTIKRNGTAVGSFTLNKSTATNIDISVPTTYSDVGAASAAHTHSYTYSDVGAASAAHTHTYSDVGAASSAHTHSGYASTSHKHLTSDVTALTGYTIATQAASIAATDSLNVALGKLQKSIDGKQASGSYVPTTRKVAGKALSADITLTYSDVSAASSAHTHTYSDVGAASSGHTHTYSDVGAASAAHTHSYVPTNRKINGKTLTADVTLTYTDVSAASSGHTHSGYAPTTHYHASNGVTVMTGYTKATASAAIATTDSLNVAIGKLEYKIDNSSGGAGKIDGISGSTINRFCNCTTAAGTAAKTASVTAGTPTLEAGLKVTVKFANKNTAGTPTFNLNSLGAKNIYVDGAQITTGSNKGILNGVLDLVYDGTQWHIVGSTMATVGMIA